MRKLRQFLKFDFDGFSKDKLFLVIGCRDWNDDESGTHLGKKIDTVIIKDETQYEDKEGNFITNCYEKVTFKVGKDVYVPEKSCVVPINAEASVWGKYSENLSVKCDDIRVLQKQSSKANA